MKVIAKSECGVIIEASFSEVTEILTSVTGRIPTSIEIGQRIPTSFDYATGIANLHKLEKHSAFVNLEDKVKIFNKCFNHLKTAINGASTG